VALVFDPSKDLFGAESSPAAIASAARLAVQAALKEASIGLMEPVMNVVITCDESSLGGIVHDISSARGGHILSLDDDVSNEGASAQDWGMAVDPKRIYAPKDPYGDGLTRGDGPGVQRTVTARVPLKEMVGYLKHLRSITGGRGSFVMSVDKFERLTGVREKAI
jgi:elongation factor G